MAESSFRPRGGLREGMGLTQAAFVNSGSPPNLGGFRLSRGGGNMGRGRAAGIVAQGSAGHALERLGRIADFRSWGFKRKKLNP